MPNKLGRTFYFYIGVYPPNKLALIPPPLLLDLYDHSAWLSIVSFRAKQNNLRFLQKFQLPTVNQINVRTYVKMPGNTEPGVYFFSLHVNSLFAVFGARSLFHLPFNPASSVFKKRGAERYIESHSEGCFHFGIAFEPQETEIKDKDLATFLTERYCIWNRKGNRLIKIPIMHTHWQLQQVRIPYLHHQLFPALNGIAPTLAHFSAYKQARLFPYETVFVIYD